MLLYHLGLLLLLLFNDHQFTLFAFQLHLLQVHHVTLYLYLLHLNVEAKDVSLPLDFGLVIDNLVESHLFL